MQLFIDNWATTLSAAVGAEDTTLQLPEASAALLSDLGNGNFYELTLVEAGEDEAEVAWEIVQATERSGNVITVARGGAARSWPAGTLIAARLTAAAMERVRDSAGAPGENGASAYEVALANGFVGSEDEWLEFLRGADGENGRGITGATVNGSGHLIFTYSDGVEEDLGRVIGPQGDPGADGAPGAVGRGISSMELDGSFHLIITYTDSTTEDAGLIPGAGGSATWGSIGGTLADQADLVAALAGKVDIEAGKGLSTNDYTTPEQGKLAGIEAGAQVNYAAATQAEAEAGTSTTLRSWTAQRVWQAMAAWWAASAMKTKLDGIANGATSNSSDATLLARANHTGSQAISTVTGLQAALDGKAPAATTRTITGTTGTLLPSDNGAIILCTSASPVTLTIQAEASGAWPAGAVVHIIQMGAGAVTIADGSGITVNVYSGLTKALRGQYAQAALVRSAANTFALAGTLGGTPA